MSIFEKLEQKRIGIVNYKNTQPLLFGIEPFVQQYQHTLQKSYPSILANDLVNHQLDIALVPIVTLLKIPSANIIGNHCIATQGVVGSVSIFSEVPLEEITTLLLDYQSNTSINLAKILCKELWHIQPQFMEAKENYIDTIQGTTAGVIIGDRAFENKNRFAYEYDLGFYWKELTNLPFVFAAWLSTSPCSDSFIEAFDEANSAGLAHLDSIAQQQNYPYYDLSKYYKENISYQFNAAMRESVNLFLKKVREV